MTCGEVAVAKRWGSPFPSSCWTTAGSRSFRSSRNRREYGRYGTELQAEEYQAPPAHYFGVPAVGVRTPEELRRVLKEAFDADGPTVIEAVVDSAHYDDTVFD